MVWTKVNIDQVTMSEVVEVSEGGPPSDLLCKKNTSNGKMIVE